MTLRNKLEQVNNAHIAIPWHFHNPPKFGDTRSTLCHPLASCLYWVCLFHGLWPKWTRFGLTRLPGQVKVESFWEICEKLKLLQFRWFNYALISLHTIMQSRLHRSFYYRVCVYVKHANSPPVHCCVASEWFHLLLSSLADRFPNRDVIFACFTFIFNIPVATIMFSGSRWSNSRVRRSLDTPLPLMSCAYTD